MIYLVCLHSAFQNTVGVYKFSDTRLLRLLSFTIVSNTFWPYFFVRFVNIMCIVYSEIVHRFLVDYYVFSKTAFCFHVA